MYDVIIGHYGEDKTSLLGSKIIVSSWKFAHWLKTASSTTYIPFFFKLKILDFVIIFLKKSDFFFNFRGQKTKI